VSFREERYNDKRRKILDSAAILFAKNGYERVTLDEIAKKLKLTKGSLYYYVKSKEDIFFQIQMQAVERVTLIVENALKSELDPLEKFRQTIKGFVRILTQPQILAYYRHETRFLPVKMRDQILNKRGEFLSKFDQLILEGVKSGIIEKENWKIKDLAVLGVVNWIPLWYSPKGKLSVEEIADIVVDFCLKGFGVNVKTSSNKQHINK
jgi:AcrR family transcriptional regulator